LTTRKVAAIESIVELVLFSAISLFITIQLFHAAIPTAPLFAFLCTFFGFSSLAAMLDKRIGTRYVVSVALPNLFFSACLLFILVNETILRISGMVRTLSLVVLVFTVILYPILVATTMKYYIRNRMKRE